jgi:hypothetical protein
MIVSIFYLIDLIISLEIYILLLELKFQHLIKISNICFFIIKIFYIYFIFQLNFK